MINYYILYLKIEITNFIILNLDITILNIFKTFFYLINLYSKINYIL